MNEMSNRTSEVSNEAVGTGSQAADLRDNTAALDRAVEELRHSVIRVVRTSTAEVDRRKTPRHEVRLAAVLSVAGLGEHHVQVSDLSEGGACVPDAPTLPMGARGLLRLDSLPEAVPCVVLATDDAGLHLSFEHDAATADALRGLVADLVVRRAA